MSVRTERALVNRWPTPAKLRKLLAAGILSIILIEAGLTITGQSSFCTSCAQSALHRPLLALGALGWGAWLAVARRSGARLSALWIGGMSGVHVALVSHLLAIPRSCGTCFTTCALALLAFATFSKEKTFGLAVAAWAVGLVLAQIVLAAG